MKVDILLAVMQMVVQIALMYIQEDPITALWRGLAFARKDSREIATQSKLVLKFAGYFLPCHHVTNACFVSKSTGLPDCCRDDGVDCGPDPEECTAGSSGGSGTLESTAPPSGSFHVSLRVTGVAVALVTAWTVGR